MFRNIGIGMAMMAFTGSVVHAESFGLPNGRTAVPALEQGGIAVEAGYVTGELIEDSDYTHIGGRLNYQYSPAMTLYADFGQSDVEPAEGAGEDDGNSFGGGLYYYLADQTTVASADVALKLAYHTADLEGDRGINSTETEYTLISGEVLLSGKQPLNEAGMLWYANLGFGQIDSEIEFPQRNLEADDDESKAILGAGLIYPLASGVLYAGVEQFSELTYGGGIRFYLQ